MLSTTESFIAELEKNGWKYNGLKELEDGKNHVGCGVTGKTTQADFHLFFDADDKSVSIRVFKLFIVPIDKKLQLLELMNKINSEYRWAKFFIGEDEWMYIYEDKYEEAKVALKEYDTSVPIEARRAQITNDFCDICIKYREKEYYDILRFLDVYYTSNNDQFYYDFKDEKIQNYFDNKMREINQYLEANEGDIYYAHGLLVREETMRRLAEGYEEYNYTGAPSKYKEKNRYDGLSSKKNKNYKEKDPSDYDIDGYYWDYKDEFYDEDDAWDDFEDNDAWDDY